MNINAIILPKSSGMPDETSMRQIVSKSLIPGPECVIIADRLIVFDALWHLSSLLGVEVSLTRDRIGCREFFRLRSGSRSDSPVTKPKFGLIRIIAHTHPSGNSQRLPSFDDIARMNDLYLHQLRYQIDALPPRSRVVYGPGSKDFTIFWPSVLR